MTSERSNGGEPGTGRFPEAGPPASVEEALSRAGRHGRAALGEALAATRALLDAACLAATGRPSDEQRALGSAARTLDALAEQLHGGEAAATLLTAALEALDEEIERWEGLSRDDPEARAVLRAFLGMREILWELGVRPGQSGGVRERRGPARVQRVPVED
ncbi:MAG: hypothetical protein ABFS46_10450 [Myxococcota bacterium]